MNGSAAIVVSHNNRNLLADCLESLSVQTLPFAAILVVDNGSNDSTGSWLRSGFPAAELLRLERNRGFSGGVNHGLRHILARSACEFVALVNNDVRLDPAWHREAYQALAADPGLGSCATCLLRAAEPHLVDTCGITWSRPGRADNLLSGQPAPPASAPTRMVFGACAAAALFRTALFRQVGLFDESLFSYQEDVDLALRAHSAGWRCVLAPAARGLHIGHGSNRPFPGGGTWADYYNARNRLGVLVSSLPADQWRRHWHAILGGECAALLASVRERRLAACAVGLAHGLLRLPARLCQRYRTGSS